MVGQNWKKKALSADSWQPALRESLIFRQGLSKSFKNENNLKQTSSKLRRNSSFASRCNRTRSSQSKQLGERKLPHERNSRRKPKRPIPLRPHGFLIWNNLNSSKTICTKITRNSKLSFKCRATPRK